MPPDPFEQPLAMLTDHRVLSEQEEAALIEVMLAGKHARAALPFCPPEALAAIEEPARRGDEARATLVRHNLRLVVSVARRYLRGAGPHLTLEDLVSFGAIGLLRGLDKFDPEKGRRLSTYVTWWIRQSIGRGIAEESRVIDLPVHVHERLAQQRKAQSQLAQKLGREPSLDEVAAALDWRPQRVSQLEAISQAPTSLNAKIRDTNDRTELGATLPDQRFDPEAAALDGTLRRDLAATLARLLSERDLRMVRAYFGFDSAEPATLEAVGKGEGLTREHVRQIIAGALARLRDDPALAAYYECIS
jgi:RNA polymerase primary sigma factor